MSDSVKSELAKALANSFGSVAIELSELLSDRIRYLRWRSAIGILERATQFAEKKGGIKSAPPLKFFLPFVETCSLEEEDDEDICDMWANLLVSASNEFQPGHLLFMRYLKEITGKEVRLLVDMARAAENSTSGNMHMEDSIDNWESFSGAASPLGRIDISNFNEVERAVFCEILAPGTMIEWIELLEGEEYSYEVVAHTFTRDTLLSKHDSVSAELLRSLNIIERVEQSFRKGRFLVEGAASCTTPIGASFVETCAPEIAASSRIVDA